MRSATVLFLGDVDARVGSSCSSTRAISSFDSQAGFTRSMCPSQSKSRPSRTCPSFSVVIHPVVPLPGSLISARVPSTATTSTCEPGLSLPHRADDLDASVRTRNDDGESTTEYWPGRVGGAECERAVFGMCLLSERSLAMASVTFCPGVNGRGSWVRTADMGWTVAARCFQSMHSFLSCLSLAGWMGAQAKAPHRESATLLLSRKLVQYHASRLTRDSSTAPILQGPDSSHGAHARGRRTAQRPQPTLQPRHKTKTS